MEVRGASMHTLPIPRVAPAAVAAGGPAGIASRARRGLVLLLATLALAGCQRESPVLTAHDKAMIVRAADLKDFGWEYGDPAPHEKFTKDVAWDGSYRIDYEFETPESEVEHPLYLAVFVTVERMASNAILAQQAERIGLNIGLGGSDLTAREIEGFYPGARFEILESGGRPVGNVFSLRKDRKVYTLLLSGFYFDDPDEWRALVDDKLRRFTAESPTPESPAAPAAAPSPAARTAPPPARIVSASAPAARTVHLHLTAPAAHALAVDNCNGAFQWGLERQVAGGWERAWGAETDACASAPLVVAAGTSREFALAITGPASETLDAGTYRAIVYGLQAVADGQAPVALPADQRASAPFRYPAVAGQD